MSRASFGVLSVARGARGMGIHLTRGLAVALALRLVALGPPAAVAADPGEPRGETLEQVWARARTTGYQDAATCTPAAMLHGCPQPASPDPSLAPKYEKCVAEYAEGYRLGEQDPKRKDMLEEARRRGDWDRRDCTPMRNSPSLVCRAEWEREYRAGYGLSAERCREKWKKAEGARQAAAVDSGASGAQPAAATPTEQASASIPPPQPEMTSKASAAKAAPGRHGPSALPLLVGLGAGAAVGAYYLGQNLAAMQTPTSNGGGASCSTWGASHCSSASDARQDSSGYCHCCLQVCSGSCTCMGCGTGCSGSSLMCVNGTCVFRIGEAP